MSNSKEILHRQVVEDVFVHEGQTAKLQTAPDVSVNVLVIMETHQDIEEGAPVVEIEYSQISARWNGFMLRDEDLEPKIGQALTLDEPFLGKTRFEITGPPVPHGRRGSQYLTLLGILPEAAE